MPGCARSEIVRDGEPGVFHCFSRCVRRAFLLGIDPVSKRDLNHRRQWLIERLELLAANFAIDVGFLAILANHFHLVLRTNPRLVKRMGSLEVARRWLSVYPGKRVLDGNWIEPTEAKIKALAKDKKKLKKIRKRLASVSWFMSALKEYIARRCNLEDGCRGTFFESRYGCRAIESNGALLLTGIYNDLNQIRAGEALTPETSVWCSVWYRIEGQKQEKNQPGLRDDKRMDRWLAALTLERDHLGEVPSKGRFRSSDKGLLPMTLNDYLRLLDFSGRQLRKGKSGAIPADLEPILIRLGIVPEEFLNAVEQFPKWFRRFAGNTDDFVERAKQIGRSSLHGISHARRVFRESS